jgi:RNA polymerase sigma factor (sigma-70 family)
VVHDDSPPTDPRVIALKDAKAALADCSPKVPPVDELRAFQLISADGGWSVRLNRQVRGLLVAKLTRNPNGGARPLLEVVFNLLPDERKHAAHVEVFQWRVGGRLTAIPFWDTTPFIVQNVPAAHLEKMIRRLLAPGAASRWAGQVSRTSAEDVNRASVEDVVSSYWTAATEQSNSGYVAPRVLERLEQSLYAGRPGRRSKLKMLPIDRPNRGPDDPTQNLAAPTNDAEDDHEKDLQDLERAVGTLPDHAQEILRLRYYGGRTDRQIADSLGISQQAVNKSRLRAQASLRNLLNLG